MLQPTSFYQALPMGHNAAMRALSPRGTAYRASGAQALADKASLLRMRARTEGARMRLLALATGATVERDWSLDHA